LCNKIFTSTLNSYRNNPKKSPKKHSQMGLHTFGML